MITVSVVAAKTPGLLPLADVLVPLLVSERHFGAGKAYANRALRLQDGDLPVDLSAFSHSQERRPHNTDCGPVTRAIDISTFVISDAKGHG